MAKLRHIALSVADAETARKFFEQAFDMKVVGKPQSRGYYMSDGTINVALLERDGRPLGWEKDEPFFGIDHFGMWVDDITSAEEQAKRAGATLVRPSPTNAQAFYEAKFKTPDGIVFDLTYLGWPGAVKNP